MKEKIPLMSVSEVNRLANELLSNLTVRVVGELDERFNTSRGYGIGNLSDADATISIYIPAGIVSKNREHLAPGQKIVVEGRLGIYEPYGKYSLTVSAVEPHGEGVLQQELAKRKRELAKLGYFDEARKRPLPEYPMKIGVITAVGSAAWNDFKKHVVKEYAGLTLFLHDALMQGAYAVDSVQEAFARLAKEELDLIVLTRGGGSLQDLMPFNSKELVEAIVNSPHPVISAIGHEIDITLADLAADFYVSTPTKAAEVIAQKYAVFKNELSMHQQRLERIKVYYKNLPVELDNAWVRLDSGMRNLLKYRMVDLQKSHARLKLLSPMNTLKRGYSITFDKNGMIIKSVNKLSKKDIVRTRLFKGEFSSVVQ